jgi:hypothetical protein
VLMLDGVSHFIAHKLKLRRPISIESIDIKLIIEINN